MDVASLAGRSIRNLWAFRLDRVHPAWNDANTLPIAAFDAVLEFSDGQFVKLSPCEVDLGRDRHPALGLKAQPCGKDGLIFLYQSGQIVEAKLLAEASMLMPFHIIGVDMLDPLGEDTITEYLFLARGGQTIGFRHMMPPMTLGIRLGPAGPARHRFRSSPPPAKLPS